MQDFCVPVEVEKRGQDKQLTLPSSWTMGLLILSTSGYWLGAQLAEEKGEEHWVHRSVRRGSYREARGDTNSHRVATSQVALSGRSTRVEAAVANTLLVDRCWRRVGRAQVASVNRGGCHEGGGEQAGGGSSQEGKPL